MNNLNSDEYQKVLLLMQSTNEEDFQRAAELLRSTGFDLQKAISLSQQNRQSRNHLTSNRKQVNQPSDEAIAIRYMNHLRSKNQQWSLFGSFFTNCKTVFCGFFKFIAQILLPQPLVLKLLRSQFYQLYSKRFRLLYKQQELIKLLQKTKNKDKRSVMIAVSNRQTHQVFVDLFNKREIVTKVDLNFHFAGYMLDDKQLDLLAGEKFAPEILICRMNIFEEVIVIGRFRGDELRDLNPQTLTRCYKEGENLCKRDQNVLIKYRNYINKVCGYNFVEEEEDEIDFVDLQRNTEQIRRQNQTYKQIEESQRDKFQLEQKQRQKAIQELKEIEEYQELRKIRKMSLPEEPVDGQIVRISFRCPDGTTIIRNFATSEKVELLFTWVELNQDIAFQDPRKCFQIMYSYPPQPLSHQKQRLLSQIFQESHEKVLIRQL